MKNVEESFMEGKTFPDDFFISCLCCIPRAWTLFANDQWVRIFENHNDGLRLIREFLLQGKSGFATEPISPMDRVSIWLDESLWNNGFDDLVIVAPRHTLSALNRTLSKHVLARTIAEINWPSISKKYNLSNHRFHLFHSARDKNQ